MDQQTEQKYSPSLLNRREFFRASLATVLALSGAAPAGCTRGRKDANTASPSHETGIYVLDAEKLRQKIDAFSWEEAKDPAKMREFTHEMAQAYLALTKSPRINLEDLAGEESTMFFTTRTAYLESVRALVPDYEPSDTQWGFTEFATGKVFFDLESMEAQSRETGSGAGVKLIAGLWHEWGHKDIEERVQGQLLNNPNYYFLSPYSGQNEQFRSYRGAQIFTDTYYGMYRFEEVLNETIAVRRMIEQVGMPAVDSARDYYANGVDFFPQFTQAAGLSVDELYQYHATSDFEGLAQKIGQALPGQADPMVKGVSLFVGIHLSDPTIIQKSGAYSIVQ